MAICRRAGFAPKVSMYLEQMMTAYYLACEGKGIAFVRDALLDCLPPTDKVFFYRIDSPESERGIYLSYKKSGLLQKIRRPHPNTARLHRIHEKSEAPARKRKGGGRIKPPPRGEILPPLLSP